jgi:hypothetical protein
MAQYATNLLIWFPIKVNGAPPPSTDTFSATPSDATTFSAAIGVTPGSGPDAGLPAVLVTPLTLAGATGLSFTVNDGQNDLPATEDFDLIAPVAPPPPPGQISIDDAGVQTQANPNPPTS